MADGSIMATWPEAFRARYGGDLPRDYTAFDLETTGFSHEKDVIVEWGHCLVRDGEPKDRLNLVINWLDHPVVPREWVIKQLERTRRRMQLNGKAYRITPEVMAEEGIPPERALPFMYEFLTALQKRRHMLVSHNGWTFDTRMLVAHFEGFLEQAFAFEPDSMLDTAGIEKASQLVDEPKSRPRAEETLEAYFRRISGWRAAGKSWNLERCVQKYGLTVDGDLHSAGTDAYVVHLLMERFRQDLATTPDPVTVAMSTAATTKTTKPTRRRRRQKVR